MTPAARIQAAIEVLESLESSRRPLATVLEIYFRRRRYAGSGDRRAIGLRVWEVVRHRARLDWWLVRSNLAPEPRTRVLALVVLKEGTEAAALFSGAGHGPASLSPPEQGLVQALSGHAVNHPDMPDRVRLEIPEWLEPSLRLAFADRLAEEMEALNQLAPVDVRVNTLAATRDEARAALAAEGIEGHPTPRSPLGLRLEGTVRLAASRAFRSGLVEVQDEGSQLAARAVEALPGLTVVDYCAGAGGKTLALAAAMAARGRLVACDESEQRLAPMMPRLVRAGLERFVERRLLVPNEPPWIAADRVLVDAPCSGSGIWRRHPETKWRLSPDELEDLTRRQASILDQAWPLVKRDGRLIYVTCSVLPQENHEQMARFAERTPGVRVRIGPVLGPARDKTDGFFVASVWRCPGLP